MGNIVKMHQNLPLFYTRSIKSKSIKSKSIKSKRKKNKDHLWLINPIRHEAIKIRSSYTNLIRALCILDANLIFNIIMSKINYKKMIVIYTTNLIKKIEIYI
jgi:hypothetical protein